MNKQIFEYHPVIGYRYIPNLQTRITHESGGYLLKSNSLGFRSESEFSQTKTPGKKRILLFGDSFTAADGVSNKKRYSDVLMQMLPDTEIYNFGVNGTGTDQHYLIFREYAKNIEHDMIIITVFLESVRRVNAQYRIYLDDRNKKMVLQKPYFELDNGNLLLKNIPVNPNHLNLDEFPYEEKDKVDAGGRYMGYQGIKNIINKLGLKSVVRKLANYQPLPEYNRPDNKEWLLLKSIILKWMSEVKKPVLLIPLPIFQYVEGQSASGYYDKRFREFTGMKNVTVYNPLEDLKRYPLSERRKFRFEVDVHPTALGHEAYAKAFKPQIEEILKNN